MEILSISCMIIHKIRQEIASCQLQPGHDKWTCLLTPEGSFTVEVIRRRVDKLHNTLPVTPVKFRSKLNFSKILFGMNNVVDVVAKFSEI
uniref:Uncharacterized protein n=1 Tax=Lactuca sativa TaxID=4236 RepID=A0A9R1WAM6_LACSA|nr:hypothetical protein LSAT_V11C300131890 [Lactuca sativa]